MDGLRLLARPGSGPRGQESSGRGRHNTEQENKAPDSEGHCGQASSVHTASSSQCRLSTYFDAGCTTCGSRACAAPRLCRVIRNSRVMVLCYQFDDAPNVAIELVQLVGRDQVFPVTRASDLMLWVAGQERRVNVEASHIDVGVDGGLFLRAPGPGDLGRIFVVQRCLEDGLPWW